MSLLDHCDIVGTISNGKRNGVLDTLANTPDELCFLAWLGSAAYNGVGENGQVEEEFFNMLALGDHSKRLTVYYDYAVSHFAVVDSHDSRSNVLFDLADFPVEYEDSRIVFDKTARVTNIDCRLPFVACEHPHTDIGAAELVN